MKEYKVAVRFRGSDVWRFATKNCCRAKVFYARKDAEAWIAHLIEYHEANDHLAYSGAVYKVMERDVTAWTDAR